MKILDRYILTTYLKTFISVFVILMLIFVLQAIWLYIKELAGKDLDLVTVLKFLMYITPTLIPLILPLTILLSSIMVFGNFAENYEFAAMKSTGISLQRAMSGLGIFIVGLSLLTFFFSNNVIPWAEYNSYNLRKNIAKVKPAMAIAEGQFNDVGDNFNIKVLEKSGENGKDLKGVTIHKKNNRGVNGNHVIIVADRGELASEKDSEILKLILFDGYYYDDTPPKKYEERRKKPFVKSEFKKHVMNIDLSQLNNIDLDEKNTTDRYTMLNIKELDYAIDSLKTIRVNFTKNFASSLYTRTNLETLNLTVKPKKDSVYNGEILDIYKTNRKIQILDYAINNISSTQQIIKSKDKTYAISNSWINRHGIALHKKFALAVACIILFFVGAPLGALIKKGGLGLPMVLAIVLFLSYHFIGLFAENSAKNGDLNPVFAAWFSTIIMFPLSIYLTTRATADKGIFETDGILEPLKKLFGIKKPILVENTNMLAQNSSEQVQLLNLNDDKLVDIIKNYRQYNYSIAHKNSALNILEERGITKQQLRLQGKLTNQKFEEIIRIKQQYDEDSKLSLILYLIGIISSVGGAVMRNNGLPTVGSILLYFGIAVQIIFIFALIKSFSKQSDLYRLLEKNSSFNGLVYALFGFTAYIALYFVEKKQIEQDLNLSSDTANNSNKISEPEVINSDEILDTTDYKALSKLSLIFFSVALVLFILYFVFKNNKLPQLATAGIQISIISYIVFIFNYIKATISFNKLISNLKDVKSNPILTIIGLILYPVTHFIRRQKIKF